MLSPGDPGGSQKLLVVIRPKTHTWPTIVILAMDIDEVSRRLRDLAMDVDEIDHGRSPDVHDEATLFAAAAAPPPPRDNLGHLWDEITHLSAHVDTIGVRVANIEERISAVGPPEPQPEPELTPEFVKTLDKIATLVIASVFFVAYAAGKMRQRCARA